MPLKHNPLFTDEEFIAAFSLILPPAQARREALAFNSLPDIRKFDGATAADLQEAGVAGPRSYDGDLLDLLSLVSDDCASRAWRLMGLSPEEGEARRDRFRKKVEEAMRQRS